MTAYAMNARRTEQVRIRARNVLTGCLRPLKKLTRATCTPRPTQSKRTPPSAPASERARRSAHMLGHHRGVARFAPYALVDHVLVEHLPGCFAKSAQIS